MNSHRGWKGKHYWIVGASEGLGRALAVALSEAGAELTLSARNQTRLEELAATLPGPSHVAPCDLSSSESVAGVSDQLEAIDGVILLAGYYEPMPADEWVARDVERMCDTNLTGTARALGVAMPVLLTKKHGHIVFIGSLAGHRGLPGNVGYGASKAGMMHLAECLHLDLDPDLYRVQVINPGFIQTRLTDKNTFEMPYMLTAEKAAATTLHAMERNKFCIEFPWQMALWFRLLGLLPDWLYFPIVRRLMRSESD